LADNDFAYLIDFGIARAADDTGLTSEGSTIGTWAYMAPERFQSGDIEPSSDIYALACVFYQCLTGEPPFPGNTLEQVAVGHMVAPPPRASEAKDTVPTGLDRVIETGLAKQTTERYSTAVEMAAAARRAITEPTVQPNSAPTQLAPISDGGPRWPASSNPPLNYPTPLPQHGPPPQWAPQQWGPPPQHGQPTPVAKPSGRRRGVLIGAIVLIAAMIVVAGTVFAVVGLNRGDDSPAKPSAPAAAGGDFSGTYRVDYGPGTDLDGKPVPNAPATTSSWDIRSECGVRGCVATAASASGNSLLSNMTFDQLGGTWVAVGIASAECGGDTPSEVWVVVTLRPQSDGSLTGETVRSSTDSLCAAKRAVKFTRTGDPDLGKVPDPAVLPPRVVSPADGLRGSYRQTTTFTNGSVVPGQVLTADTYCLRTGDRCMSLFHAGGGAVTLMYADDKWTRHEQGTTTCGGGGTAQTTITAEYPMPRQLDDPIAVLTGRGSQTVATGGACTGGGDFEDQFQRTGD
jgi:serine/threonine-protein kinase